MTTLEEIEYFVESVDKSEEEKGNLVGLHEEVNYGSWSPVPYSCYDKYFSES